MTYKETAAAMRRLADCIDLVVAKFGKDEETGAKKPMLTDDAAIGAAILLCYLRDLVTANNRESYDRGTLLAILETISRDNEILPLGIGTTLWQADDE